eukprot:Nk52_evm18s241 gene=Nk52_evmTU18s241
MQMKSVYAVVVSLFVVSITVLLVTGNGVQAGDPLFPTPGHIPYCKHEFTLLVTTKDPPTDQQRKTLWVEIRNHLSNYLWGIHTYLETGNLIPGANLKIVSATIDTIRYNDFNFEEWSSLCEKKKGSASVGAGEICFPYQISIGVINGGRSWWDVTDFDLLNNCVSNIDEMQDPSNLDPVIEEFKKGFNMNDGSLSWTDTKNCPIYAADEENNKFYCYAKGKEKECNDGLVYNSTHSPGGPDYDPSKDPENENYTYVVLQCATRTFWGAFSSSQARGYIHRDTLARLNCPDATDSYQGVFTHPQKDCGKSAEAFSLLEPLPNAFGSGTCPGQKYTKHGGATTVSCFYSPLKFINIFPGETSAGAKDSQCQKCVSSWKLRGLKSNEAEKKITEIEKNKEATGQ